MLGILDAFWGIGFLIFMSERIPRVMCAKIVAVQLLRVLKDLWAKQVSPQPLSVMVTASGWGPNARF